MVTGDGNSESAFGQFLTSDVIESSRSRSSYFCIIIFNNMRCVWCNRRLSTKIILRAERREGFNLTEVKVELEEIRDSIESNIGDKRGLSEISFGEIDFGVTGLFGSFDDINDAADRLSLAVEGEFADEETIFSVLLEELARENKDSEGDWEIEV